jgi:hypothetical protein
MGVLKRYMLTPGKENWRDMKIVVRYLCGRKDYSICYQEKPRYDSEVYVHGFIDANWVGDLYR